MAYQNIRRTQVRPSHNLPETGMDDESRRLHMKQRRDYELLAQQVNNLHNLIQNFTATAGGGVTTLAVTLPSPMPDDNYNVNAEFGFNAGNWWITSKTANGFTVNWTTAAGGARGIRFGIIG